MKTQIIIRLFLSFVLLTQSTAAFETDQYNLPPAPLADIGDEVTQYVETNVKKAFENLNKEISARQLCLEAGGKFAKIKCDSPDKEREKLAQLRAPQAVAREVYNLLGTGIPPLTNSGSWMESHHFKHAPARYKTKFCDSIFLTFPTDFIGLSSTVKLYGAQFGTDKIAHFFQQGYSYYKIYNRALAEGSTPGEAARKAVKWGQKTERTIYGTLISGVYSNADLFANYAGMKFYLGLARPIKIGEFERPAALILKNGLWEFNNNYTPQNLIKPFISNHLNEAFNPSIFTKMFGLHLFVRRVVKKQSCKQWLQQFPNISAVELEKTSLNLKLWNGEDYGFTESENFITIANTCFDNDSFISSD
ncbi:MAG: hypothetical protein ACR2GD_00970 [Pyrinomonadaceae bacterium]